METKKEEILVIDKMIEQLQKSKNRLRGNEDIPEFYMITVKGEHGSKVRHASYGAAVEEATRLAKKLNHTAHIMGVVAVIEPVEVQKPIIEYQLKRR